MKHIKKILLFTVLFGTIYACSVKKDTVINRNYHALTTYFNILFNGEEVFKEGIEGINQNYKDDWFQQLPIEAIVFDDRTIAVPTFSNKQSKAAFGFKKNNAITDAASKEQTPFEKAEEKAVKAIQKHGMNIKGSERNRQIDDAYLLLGKSRYYSQRFVPAIEAFNYVIANYPNASLIAETKIWRAKANIRMGNEEFAIETMNLLLFITDSLEANFPDKIKEQANTTLAMAYVQSDSLQKAKKHLRLAIRTQENTVQAARNMFVLGQMYANESKKDSASAVYNKLTAFKKAPHKYKIYAHIELAKNAFTDSLSSSILARLEKLIKDRENRPYLDQLYYQVGVLHEKNNSTSLAITYYNKSIQAKGAGDKQKSFTYENLGNLYFKASEYKFASSYYDSVLNVAVDSLNLRIRRVKRKYKNLANLIKFEGVVATNDSILRIAAMSFEAQEEFFQKYIDNLKKKDEEAAQLRLNQIAFGGTSSNSLQGTNKGKWYFYNSQSLGFGKSEFQRIWGDRKLEDNWRWSSSATFGSLEKDSVATSTEDTRYNLVTYLESIPKEKEQIDTLKLSRNEALYELGIIYKEQFKNKVLAIKRLERVLNLNPRKDLVLPINWHLYQIYKDSGKIAKANIYENVILTEYADTAFAQIIKNPNKKIEEDIEVNEIEAFYKELYYAYKKGQYKEVVANVSRLLPLVANYKLKPKFELLKAYAIGKHLDKNAYKEALEFILISYSNTEEGKRAKEILNQLNK